MTVEQLIERLQQEPNQEAVVFLRIKHRGDIEIKHIYTGDDGEPETEESPELLPSFTILTTEAL